MKGHKQNEPKGHKTNMKLNPVGSNQTEIENEHGVTVLYSYSTPVAAFVPSRGALCTTQKYSRTTSKHITLALNRWGATRHNVEQSVIDEYANGKQINV
jgi:hypothetical protein